MRRLWRVAAVLVLLAPVPAGAQVSDDERVYSFYSLRSTADGVLARFFVEGFLPIEEFVGLSSVTSEANLGALRSSSLAALPDPGDLVLTLPGTLSALAGVSGLPDYPAAAAADHPASPEDEVVFAPDAGLGAGRLRAEAAADRAAASAAVGDIRDAVGLLPSFTIGSVRTTAETVRPRPGVLEATATSVLTDVRMAGGLLRIAEVASEVTVSAVDGELSADVSEISIAGVELAGQRVAISEEGIVGLGQPTALAPAIELLRAPLDAAGVELTVTPGSSDVGDGQATATGGSLDIEVPLTVQGFPGSFTLRLAPVSVALEVVEPPADAPQSSIGIGGDSAAVATPSGTGSAAVPTRPGSPASPASPTPAAGDGHLVERIAMAVPADAAGWDVRRLYAWMAVTGVLMVLAGPLAARWAAQQVSTSDLRPFWRW